jgi:hypothetical protein
MEGPLPRDYRGRKIWDSYAVLADEGRMEFLVMGGKKLAHNANKGTFYIFSGMGVFFCMTMTWMVLTSVRIPTIADWFGLMTSWMVPLVLFAIGYHYQRKENMEEDTPNFVFDRDHSTVTVPQVDRLPAGEYRFEDVEGYFVKGPVNKFGLSNYYLQLVVYKPGTEEQIGSFFLWAGPIISYEQALAHWSRLCQFMNKSEPFPNFPLLWGALVGQMIRQRGWQGRAGREAAMDEVAHAFAQEMRSQGLKEGLGVESHVDPASRDYEGPRSYEYYRRLYPTEA